MQLRQVRLKWGNLEKKSAPITAFGTRLIPIKHITHIKWPGGNVIWQRPVAIEVQQGDQNIHLPIRNMTRRLVAGFALAGTVLVIVVSLGERMYASKQRSKKT